MENILGNLDLSAALGGKPAAAPENPKTVKGKRGDIRVAHRMGRRAQERKSQSEKSLEDAINRWAFEEGDCYHCFTFGDVDFITFVKFIVRQQHCRYMAVSSWIVSGEDVLDLRSWYRRGFVDRIDLYVGEIFERSYPEAFQAATELVTECGGRLSIIRNHAKLVVVHGDRFDAMIESSANMNTNPRSENTVITVDRQTVRDCIDFLAGIVPYNRNTCGAAPYRIGG